jgi:hypothetical protein
MWSAVCSQTSMGGRHRGAKMTRGGGRRTSRAPIRARSASAPQGRQEPGRRPACDAMDVDGDSEGDSDAQPTGQTRDGRAGHRHVRRPRTRWSACCITRSKAPKRLGTTSRMPQRLVIRSLCSSSVCRMPRRTSGQRLSSPPACSSLPLSFGAGLVGVAPWCSCDPPTQVWSLIYALLGFDHGVGHPLLLLYAAKTSHGKNINDFNGLGYDPPNASISLFWIITKYGIYITN